MTRWNISSLLTRRESTIGWLCIVAATIPALALAWDAWHDMLGTNPLERLERDTGRWAFMYLIVTLSMSPGRRAAAWVMCRLGARNGRRLSDWNPLIRLRRQFGLTCFSYACLHVGIYAELDAGLDPRAVADDLMEKPYILAGAVALLMLAPLAATSTRCAMRRLGGRWKTLHRLTYAVAIAATCHFVWLAKHGQNDCYAYGGIVGALLAYRLLAHFGWWFPTPSDRGIEVSPRVGTAADTPPAQSRVLTRTPSDLAKGPGQATENKRSRSGQGSDAGPTVTNRQPSP